MTKGDGEPTKGIHPATPLRSETDSTHPVDDSSADSVDSSTRLDPPPPWAGEHSGWIVACLVSSVRAYQRFLRPLVGQRCRFYPSCSEYMILALRRHGVILGLFKGFYRIARCHPLHPGGVDYP